VYDVEVGLRPGDFARVRNSLSRWRAGCIILGLLLVATLFWGFLEHSENRMTQHLRKDEILTAASRLAADSPERMEALFDSARFLRLEEAIPLAVTFAIRPSQQDGQTQYHVFAARRYLKSFEFGLIEMRVREIAVSGAIHDVAGLLAKLPEVLR